MTEEGEDEDNRMSIFQRKVERYWQLAALPILTMGELDEFDDLARETGRQMP